LFCSLCLFYVVLNVILLLKYYKNKILRPKWPI
jgi:hypothetical protein